MLRSILLKDLISTLLKLKYFYVVELDDAIKIGIAREYELYEIPPRILNYESKILLLLRSTDIKLVENIETLVNLKFIDYIEYGMEYLSKSKEDEIIKYSLSLVTDEVTIENELILNYNNLYYNFRTEKL